MTNEPSAESRYPTVNVTRPLVVSAASALLAAVGAAVAALTTVPCAAADATAYLVNVTVRPGYNFASADDALNYGAGLCDTVTAGTQYEAVMAKVKVDFQTSDDYQAAYLVNQAVNELCPAQIWQLRRTAAGYRPAEGAR